MSRILPVSFSLPLVRRIRSGDKVATRRPVNPQPLSVGSIPGGGYGEIPYNGSCEFLAKQLRSPMGIVGDLLYVRETARVLNVDLDGRRIQLYYEADGLCAWVPWPDRIKRPVIGQCLANGAYREACRTWLEVTAVRVDRLNEITDDGAIHDGMQPCGGRWIIPGTAPECRTPIDAFREAWGTFYTGPKSWASNPFVWIYAFRMVDAPVTK